ncbi:MAG: hypothetical protein LZF86_190112 [Nitrospira sp.]|nr:MAG: hypothetical protein LZF86_190112 [Nitrospira sp.]
MKRRGGRHLTVAAPSSNQTKRNLLPAVALSAAATTVAATTAAATKSATAAATTASAGLLRARFIDGQSPAAEIGAIQRRNCRLCFRV